jgi:hypothetical protein
MEKQERKRLAAQQCTAERHYNYKTVHRGRRKGRGSRKESRSYKQQANKCEFTIQANECEFTVQANKYEFTIQANKYRL